MGLGVVLMIAQYISNPEFFRRKTEVAPAGILDPAPAAAGD
jgi:hypothetical protein